MYALAERVSHRRGRCLTYTNFDAVAQDDNQEPIDDLEARINATYGELSRLMHERNARPDDANLKARLDAKFATMRAMQEEHAQQLAARYHSRDRIPSEDSDDFKKAMELLEYYENRTVDDPSVDEAVREDP